MQKRVEEGNNNEDVILLKISGLPNTYDELTISSNKT